MFSVLNTGLIAKILNDLFMTENENFLWKIYEQFPHMKDTSYQSLDFSFVGIQMSCKLAFKVNDKKISW